MIGILLFVKIVQQRRRPGVYIYHPIRPMIPQVVYSMESVYNGQRGGRFRITIVLAAW